MRKALSAARNARGRGAGRVWGWRSREFGILSGVHTDETLAESDGTERLRVEPRMSTARPPSSAFFFSCSASALIMPPGFSGSARQGMRGLRQGLDLTKPLPPVLLLCILLIDKYVDCQQFLPSALSTGRIGA